MNKKLLHLLLLGLIISFFSCGSDKNNTSKKNIQEEIEIPKSDLAILDSLVKSDPKNSAGYFNRARYFYRNNLQPKALIDILTAIKLNSSVANYYSLGGDIYLQMNQGQEAVDIITEGITANPKNEMLFKQAIQVYIYMKEYKKGLILVNDLLKLNKNNADAYFLKGLIYKELENKIKAISSFQTCVEQAPDFYEAYMQLGLLFSSQHDDLAINYFDNAIKLQEKSREAFYGKAFYFQQEKKYNKAKYTYKQMIKNDRKDYQAFYNLGYCLTEQDSLQKAYKHFKIASNLKVDYVDAIFMLGQIAERIGDIKNAKIHYHNASRLLPENEIIKEALENLK